MQSKISSSQHVRRSFVTEIFYSILLVNSYFMLAVQPSSTGNLGLRSDTHSRHNGTTELDVIRLSTMGINDTKIELNSTRNFINSSESDWISNYFKFPTPGDTLPDFSYAGYSSGNTPIPLVNNILVTISPTNDQSDRTHDIQAAIDSMPGNLGVILFKAGNYSLSNTSAIRLPSSVILRGESNSSSQTILQVTGPPRNLFEIGDPKASGSLRQEEGISQITQTYVGVGAKSVQVQDGSVFKIGQSIVLQRLVTRSWVDAMNMSSLVRRGKPEVWLPVGMQVNQEREITSIVDNQIFWEVPLTDSINLSLSENTARVVAYQAPVRVQQVGIENMVFSQVESSSGLKVGMPAILPIKFGGAEDCWIRNIESRGFLEFSYLMPSSRRITMSDFVVVRNQPTSDGGTGALPLDITLGGTQALLLRGKTVGAQETASYIVATARLAAGPNVVSDYTATGSTRHMIEPHQRWSTGFLVENSQVGQINLRNRKTMGTGHGWAIATGIIWSSSATKMVVENPPMSRNFKIQSNLVKKLRNFRPDNYDNSNSSLYRIQLTSRIGAQAAQRVLQAKDSAETRNSL